MEGKRILWMRNKTLGLALRRDKLHRHLEINRDEVYLYIRNADVHIAG